MNYPDGAIKTFEELSNLLNEPVWCASKHFHEVQSYPTSLNLTVAHINDANIPTNGYNDWFLFTDLAKAKAYAEPFEQQDEPFNIDIARDR